MPSYNNVFYQNGLGLLGVPRRVNMLLVCLQMCIHSVFAVIRVPRQRSLYLARTHNIDNMTVFHTRREFMLKTHAAGAE